MGRFINADGLIDNRNISTVNMFVYCANNPVMNVDPSGHCPVDMIGPCPGQNRCTLWKPPIWNHWQEGRSYNPFSTSQLPTTERPQDNSTYGKNNAYIPNGGTVKGITYIAPDKVYDYYDKISDQWEKEQDKATFLSVRSTMMGFTPPFGSAAFGVSMLLTDLFVLSASKSIDDEIHMLQLCARNGQGVVVLGTYTFLPWDSTIDYGYGAYPYAYGNR